jgi:hypothetical protein
MKLKINKIVTKELGKKEIKRIRTKLKNKKKNRN